MSLIFIDARNHEVIDIVENRQQGYLRDYFLRYSLKARLQVRTVTIDMYLPYIQVIKDCFPNARMIIDRFHIVQLLNRALNQIRIQEMKKIRYSRPTDYTMREKTMEAAPQK
ncbi:Transposase and inactivated derivatives [Aerococcus viridans]|nr:Transposase and inactivated derivatives [Aerococcus viridans]